MNTILQRLTAKRALNTAEPGAGAADGGAAAAVLTEGATPPAEGATPPAAAAPATPPGEGGSAAPWWRDDKRFDEKTRGMLEAKGLTVDDPLDAMAKMASLYRNAETRLGKPADSLLDKPKDGESVTDWMKANADMFGIPEAPDKYDLKRPDSWPKDAPWNDKAEASMREKAHELGLSSAQAQAMLDLYAGTVAETLGTAEQGLQQAQEAMQAELKKDWGDAYGAKITAAQQAFQAAAEMAGMGPEAMESAARVLSDAQGGDANVLRLFAALGDMMGEDSLPRVDGSGGGLGTTPAEARAELARMNAPDSEYGKAVAEKRQGRTPANWAELQARRAHLTKLAAQT